MAFFQILYESVSKCICSLGESSYSSGGVGESIAARPKGASYAEFSPPKLRTTDLSTNLSSNIEDNQIFASRTTSRYATPQPAARHSAADNSSSPNESPAEQPEGGGGGMDYTGDLDRKSAQVLAKARIQAMKGTAIRTRRSIGADAVTHSAVPSPSFYSSRPLNERSHKRRMEIFRSRQVLPVEEFVEPKRSYNCGASADDAFHLAASIFRAQGDDAFPEHSPLPMLCFAKPLKEETDPGKRFKNKVIHPSPSISRNSSSASSHEDKEDDSSSTASSCIYHDTIQSNPIAPSSPPPRPMPLYDHYLVLVSKDHTDEIAKIMKSGTHKSFEWMHLDDSSEYMNTTGSEDKQDLHTVVSTQRLSHDDVLTFEKTSKFLLTPVTEENEKVEVMGSRTTDATHVIQ